MSRVELHDALRLVEQFGLAPLRRSTNSRPKQHFGASAAYARWAMARREVEEMVVTNLRGQGAKIDFGDPVRIRLGGLAASSTVGLERALRNWTGRAQQRLAGTRPAR